MYRRFNPFRVGANHTLLRVSPGAIQIHALRALHIFIRKAVYSYNFAGYCESIMRRYGGVQVYFYQLEMTRGNYIILFSLGYLCCIFMLYLHLSELWDSQHGILTFLKVKSDLGHFRVLVYSYFWAILFAVLLVLLFFFNVKNDKVSAAVVSGIVMLCMCISFYIDFRLYSGS